MHSTLKKNNNIKRNILSQIKSYLKNFIEGNIPTNKSLLDMGLLDSLEFIKFRFFMEKKWKIKFEEKEISDPKFFKIKNIERIILRKIKKIKK